MKTISSTFTNALRSSLGRAVLVGLVLGLAAIALAGPQSPRTVRGRAQFTQQGDTLLVQASNNTIINWSSFSILAGQSVRFVLPSQSSRILNRVTGGDRSQIEGSLLCSGRLYLINPAGVFFGRSAVVNAAALYAVAGQMTDRDFARNIDRFAGIAGSVVNEGRLQAGSVYMIGRQVANAGSIVAPEGVVTMAAASGEVFLGERNGHVLVRIDAPAAAPDGQGRAAPAASTGPANPLEAGDIYSLAVRNTGQVKAAEVILGGPGARVDVSGSVDASRPAGRGGDVRVSGERISLTGADIDASGRDGGGEVLVGEAVSQGGPLTSRVWISQDSRIAANATLRGDGGRIVIKSADATVMEGTLVARGGPDGGAGGFVETSGGFLDIRQAPDVSAARGCGGTWLLDPHDIQIVAGDRPWPIDDSASNGFLAIDAGGRLTLSPSGNISRLPVEVILQGLMRAQTVVVRTSPGGNGNGDIEWSMGAAWPLDLTTLGTPDVPVDVTRRLVLEAHNDIKIGANAGFSIPDDQHGSFQLVLFPDSDGRGGGKAYLEGFDSYSSILRSQTGTISRAESIAVPPRAPDQSLKDIVIFQAASPAPPMSVFPFPFGLNGVDTFWLDQYDIFRNNLYVSQKESVQLKAAESGARDASTTVSIRRTAGATSRPSIEAGDVIGLRMVPVRVP